MVMNEKAINVWTARFIPLILIAIVGYASYVIVGPLCVNYLLSPSSAARAQDVRIGPAIAILVIYFVLLFFVGISYFRILYTVVVNPGFVERGPQFYPRPKTESTRHASQRWKRRTDSGDSGEKDDGDLEAGSAKSRQLNGRPYSGGIIGGRPCPEVESPGLEDFWKKDVFVVEGDGRPIWCSMCMNWKPDRTHHCREVERCVRKMDHFCPWVGGIVSETNFKFFIQFVSWTTIYCIFIIVCLAFFSKEIASQGQPFNIHWVVTLALAGLFGLFAIGMTASSLQFALLNTTSVENLSRQVKIWTLAVYIARPPTSWNHKPYQTITYPLTLPAPGVPSSPPRTFAILHSKPGENPYDLGYYGNFKTVMGDNLFDWIIPLRYSPCCNHDSGESDFALGPVGQRMRIEAGLAEVRSSSEKPRRHHRHRKSRRSSTSHRRRQKHVLPGERREAEPRDVPSGGNEASDGATLRE